MPRVCVIAAARRRWPLANLTALFWTPENLGGDGGVPAAAAAEGEGGSGGRLGHGQDPRAAGRGR